MKKFIVIALAILAILCFASCDENKGTPTDTQDITDTQNESDTGSNTDTQSDTDTGSATDTQRETEIVTGTETVTDTENDEPAQNVTFDEKILFNINPWGDLPYNSNFVVGQNERLYTINEYGEKNLIYMPETYTYYICVEYDLPGVFYNNSSGHYEDDPFIEKYGPLYHFDITTKGVQKILSENVEQIPLTPSSVLFVYDSFSEFASIQKEGLHGLFGDAYVTRATVGILQEKYPDERYEMIEIYYDTAKPKFNAGQLIKTYDDFTTFLSENELSTDKITEATFEENDVFAISWSLGYSIPHIADFRIVNDKYYLTTVYDEEFSEGHDWVTYQICLIIVPKDDANVKCDVDTVIVFR
ncbi:MAG: hypothetical protein ACI3XS_06015 [Eubacteriales bacterium]